VWDALRQELGGAVVAELDRENDLAAGAVLRRMDVVARARVAELRRAA
jgi:hypothetical protein